MTDHPKDKLKDRKAKFLFLVLYLAVGLLSQIVHTTERHVFCFVHGEVEHKAHEDNQFVSLDPSHDPNLAQLVGDKADSSDHHSHCYLINSSSYIVDSAISTPAAKTYVSKLTPWLVSPDHQKDTLIVAPKTSPPTKSLS